MSVGHLSSHLISLSRLILSPLTKTIDEDEEYPIPFRPKLQIRQSITSELEIPSVTLDTTDCTTQMDALAYEEQIIGHGHGHPIVHNPRLSSMLSAMGPIPTPCHSITHSNISDLTLETSMSYDSSFDDRRESMPMTQLLLHLTTVSEEVMYAQHGYRKIQKIGDTQQGELIEAWDKENDMKVIIKKCDKSLLYEHVSIRDCDDMQYLCEDDIRKEAEILKYLTIHNKATDDFIVKYINFFDSDENYYLVTESTDNYINLKQFVEKAHDYIKDGTLEIKEYQKVIKYIFWQICSTLHWLHQDMRCCVLNLSMESIMLENAEFIENSNGSISIASSVVAKFTDFSKAEVFEPKNKGFRCMKHELLNDVQYLSPKIYSEQIYDARKSEMWALGMMLYHAVIGKALFSELNIFENENPIKGSGYWASQTNNVTKYLCMNGLSKYINKKMLKTINCLLDTDETKRMNALQILQSSWFNSYYKRYFKTRIEKKSFVQRKQLQQQQQQMQGFPYYVCLY